MAVINKQGNYMALPLKIRRGNPLPLDESAVWYDLEEMKTYAASNPVAYVGQILVHVDEEQTTVTAYMIQNTAGNLIKLAATTASGDLTSDVVKLQGEVTALKDAVGTKAPESAIAAADVWTAIEEVKAAYENADKAIKQDLTENYYDKTAADKAIDDKITAAVSAAYKPGGSLAFAELATLLTKENLGKVYNITDEFTTDANFVEGVGKKYPAGTNVACINVGGESYKWDVMTGVMDLSGYATTEALNTGLGQKVDKVPGSALVEETLIQKLTNMKAINTVSEELNVTPEGELQVKAIAQDKVTGLADALGKKVDAESGKGLSEANFTNTLLEKLNGIDAGAQVNVIEAIKINDVPMQVSEKAVNIPIATAAALGLVKSSDAEGGVVVTDDGAMTVKKLNVNALVQTEGERLVLDGGDSANR